MKRKLGDLAIIVKSKDSVEKIDRNKYVTTENMISNRGGVSFPSSTVPKQKKLDMFDKDDVLVSNIRPYFKKIWKASFSGYKSGDVLAFRTKDRDILSQEYLYILLESDRFFEYMTTTAKGTKMPRGDKKAIAEFPFDLPSIDIQKKRSHQIEVIEQKIRLNQQINANLDEIKTAYFDKSFNQQMQSNLNGKLKNITKITSGKRPNKKSDTKSSKDKYPIVGASKVMGYTDNYLYNEPILTTGRVGTHGIIQRFREPVWVSDNSFVFKTDHEDYLFEILNHWINYSALNRGSTQPLITQTDLKNIDIYVPTESELKKFERVSRILTNLQFSLIKQNRRLDQIKKTLLNKLLL